MFLVIRYCVELIYTVRIVVKDLFLYATALLKRDENGTKFGTIKPLFGTPTGNH